MKDFRSGARIAMRALTAVSAFAALGLFAGCPSNSSTQSSAPPVVHTAAFHGSVYGGRQAINLSVVHAYSAGLTTGGTATLIGTATTAADGTFTMTFSPTPASGAVIYVVATGGDSLGGGGLSANTAINLATVAGTYCTSADPACFPASVQMNELTTVATAYSMAGFTSISSGVVNMSGSSPGLDNAAKTFANLVSAATGQEAVPGITAGCTGSGEPTNCAALRTLDTLANITAGCVNTTGPGSGACSSLFTPTTPSGGTAPVDTFTALYNIVTGAGDVRNKGSGIYALSPVTPIFAPPLTAAPNAWTLALNFTGGGLNSPQGIAIDAAGNVWIASANNSTVNKFDPTGNPLSGSGYTGGGLSLPIAIAIDASGNAWTANIASSVSKFDSGGTALSGSDGYTGGGLSGPFGIAIDAAGNVWTTSNNSTVNEFDSSGTALSGSSGFTGGGLSLPEGIAIDVSGNAWTASGGNSTVNEFDSSGTALSGSSGFTGGGLSSPKGIAIDASGNVWTTSSGNNTVNEFDSSGTALSGSSGYTGGGLNGPSYNSIAIDAAGNVWTASASNSTVNEFDSSGTALSPSTGYTGGGLSNNRGIAIDASGSVWIANQGNSSITELIGAAAPTRTPLVTTLTDGFTP